MGMLVQGLALSKQSVAKKTKKTTELHLSSEPE